MKRMMIFLFCIISFCGCSAAKTSQKTYETATETVFAMDGVMNLTAYDCDLELMNQAKERIVELEGLFSATNETAEIFKLNHKGTAELSADTINLLNQAIEICQMTEGALDLSVYPVVQAWGFTTDSFQVPAKETVSRLLSNVDYTKIQIDGNRTTLPEGMEIDFGSVAKGYTGDQLVQMLKENGIKSAILDLSGNIHAVGTKPDGEDWRVAIYDPAGNDVVGALSIRDKAVITSGGYTRFFEDEQGNKWWHIIDPNTGYPAERGLVSVTIVGEKGVLCDGLSTALFVMGKETAVSFWKARKDFDMALITDDGVLLITPNLAKCFQPAVDIKYKVQVIGE